MATKKFRPITKDELTSILDRQIRNSVGYYDSKLSKERENVTDYYNGTLPKPHHAGNSKYVSRDVFDAVESMKAVLLETFASGNKIVSFDPESDEDVEPSRIATEYCDYVVFRQNNGYQIFSDMIHDGLTSRIGVAKVYWKECEEEIEEEFSNVGMDELQVLLAGDAELVELEGDEETGLYEGRIKRVVDKSHVQIDVIPPEEFLITPQSTSIKKAPFCAHRSKKSRSDLIKMGFPADRVAKISATDDAELTMNPEVLSRFDKIGADRLNLDGEVQEQAKEVVVYECYMHLDMEGSGKTKLYKIVKAGNVLLEDPEEIDCNPFLGFVPLPTPHSVYGTNYAANVIPTQNARTILVRGILDHTLVTNNPRYQVVKGGLVNPKELIENRIGGLVNVTRPDAITPLQQASLNPFVFQTIQLLDADKEEATGVSQLSQGLNKDAVSKQNSQGLVENLVSLSMQREKIIARNFANQFIKELYLEVYRLVVANEKAEKVIQIAGNFVRVSPSDWMERTDCTIELKLGYGEQEQEAAKFFQMHQMLSADPTLADIYNAGNKYQVLKTAYEKAGVKNVAAYLTDPKTVQPKGPDPMLLKQVELEDRKVGVMEKQAEVSAAKVSVTSEIEHMKVELARMAQMLSEYKTHADTERKDFDSAARYAIAAEELEMMRQIPAEEKNAIVSPNS